MGRVNGTSAPGVAPEPENAVSEAPVASQTPSDIGHGLRALAARLLAWHAHFAVPLQLALDNAHGTHTLDDLFALLLQERVILMTTPEAFIIAEVVSFPQAKHLHLWLGGSTPGHGEELRELSERMHALAKDLKCDRLTMSGREGWLRALEPEGWQPYHHTLTRTVQ